MRALRCLLLTLPALLLSACLQIGPAHPEQDGRAYLEKKGIPAEVIDAVVSGAPLDAARVKEFSASSSVDVRHLVARNRHLTPEQIDVFIADANDFARAGAALNPSLSTNQVEKLTQDVSHTVYCQLAGNESLTDAQMLRIHNLRNPGLLWFAMNPNCPPSLRTAIGTSGDALTKQWLGIVDGWKKDGTLVQGADGRWRRP
jgi:hypothetical protein